MANLYTQISEELSRGTDLCLAVIIKLAGSAPRGVGTRFLIKRNGSIEGTIGGGSLEARVIAEAQEALAKGASRRVHFRLQGRDVADSEMLCGGNVDVYLEPLYVSDAKAVEMFQLAGRAADQGPRSVLLTAIRPGPQTGIAGRKMLFIKGKDTLGRLEPSCPDSTGLEDEVSRLLQQRHPLPALLSLGQGEGWELFAEPIFKRPVVYIMGGGHVSMQLAGLVKLVGFDLVVADDRSEFANRERFPQADEILVRDFTKVFQDLDMGDDAYVVIVTRGHMSDKDVLAQALQKKTAYVGMIGSKRKRLAIYEALKQEGVSQDQLTRVHSPIGLEIGAQTPEEIAVAITAELIAVRNGRIA